MRHDMDKVLVEKARRGGNKFRSKTVGAWRHSKKLRDFVDEGTHARSTSKIVGWERKELNENLNPLRRFLKSNVGRKWDDVYSEICSRIDKKNAVQGHIIQHLFQYVEIDHRYQKGYKDYWRHNSLYGYIPDFYVDKDGILQTGLDPDHRISWRRRHKEQQAKKEITFWTLNGEELHKINGIWYTVDFRYVKETDFYRETYYNEDGSIKGYSPWRILVKDVIFPNMEYKVGTKYRWRKLPASSKLLKKFGVFNEIKD